MSQIRLNIIDQTETISGDVHGGIGDALIAALTAEPDTVEELALALDRFVHTQDDKSPFGLFRKYENFEPYDAGILIIDLAARVVAVESTYSMPSASGEIAFHDGTRLTDVRLPYRLPDDWLFVYSIPEYEGVRKSRRDERKLITPIDTRAVLYGQALTQFIVRESRAALNENSIKDGYIRGDNNATIEQAGKNEEAIDEAFEKIISAIHARWLMTPRDDLQGKTPRQILLAGHSFVEFDLHSRELQWSFTGKCPPPLPMESKAYLYAPFGVHEIVVYYDMIRCLLIECLEYLQTRKDVSPTSTIEFLEKRKDFFLNSPNLDYSGIVPLRYIELERQRIPFALSPQEAVIDEDCYTCQMMAQDLESIGFRHLDGAHMDEGFEFSFYLAREEWEAEQKQREEFNREFERRWREREEKGLQNGPFTWSDDEGWIQ